MKLTLEPSGVGVDLEEGRTLLFAALRDGHTVPYECASGGCGGCRARLVDGQVRSLWPDAPGLTERDRRKGDRILLCQSVAMTDCAVVVPDVAPTGQPPPLRQEAEVVTYDLRNPSTLLIELSLQHPMPYLAGQFALLELADGTRRAYSMSRPPQQEDTTIEFIIRAKPEGQASEALFGATGVGDILVIEGAYGGAHYRSSERPIVCVGGGSGIGPMLAVAEHAAGLQRVPAVDLYYGARTDDDLVLEDRLDALAAIPRTTVHRVVETTARSDTTPGRVADAAAADWGDLAEHDLYLAGPPAMVDAAIAALVRTGVAAADRVYFDRFT